MLPTSIAFRTNACTTNRHPSVVHLSSVDSAGPQQVVTAASRLRHDTAHHTLPADGYRFCFEHDAPDQLAAGACLRSAANWCKLILKLERGVTLRLCGVGPAMRGVADIPAHSALQ